MLLAPTLNSRRSSSAPPPQIRETEDEAAPETADPDGDNDYDDSIDEGHRNVRTGVLQSRDRHLQPPHKRRRVASKSPHRDDEILRHGVIDESPVPNITVTTSDSAQERQQPSPVTDPLRQIPSSTTLYKSAFLASRSLSLPPHFESSRNTETSLSVAHEFPPRSLQQATTHQNLVQSKLDFSRVIQLATDGYDHSKVALKPSQLFSNNKLPSWLTDTSQRKTPNFLHLSTKFPKLSANIN
jgi:hypothetical protein